VDEVEGEALDEVQDEVQAENEAGDDYEESERESFYPDTGASVRDKYSSWRGGQYLHAPLTSAVSATTGC
jgi:hypothetical protein